MKSLGKRPLPEADPKDKTKWDWVKFSQNLVLKKNEVQVCVLAYKDLQNTVNW